MRRADPLPPLLNLLFGTRWLDACHHLLLGDEVVDPLQEPQQALHVVAPLVQDIVCVSRLGEADDSRRPVDFRIHSLGRHQFTNVFFRLIFRKVKELGKAAYLDSSVVLGNDPNVVFDNALAQVLPSLVGLFICRLPGLSVEDVGAAQMRAEFLGDFRPPHQLVNCEEPEKLGIRGNLRVSGVAVYALKEVVLFVVVGSKNYKVNDALQNLL